jgi:DNA-binding IclR family transcriptional regulator
MANGRSQTAIMALVTDEASHSDTGGPASHRTIDRVTQILEEVVYHPGIGFAELARALDAPKSSVHGFIRGLQAKGWLYESDRRFYLGPAVYGLTLASGRIRAGQVSQADLDALHKDTGMTVFLGVEAGDHLIYIGESGTDSLTGFAARSNIRRQLISTAGGKALLAAKPDSERDAYLRRQQSDNAEAVSEFLAEFAEIRKTGVARNFRHHGSQIALASVLRNQAGESVASVTLVGQATEVEPREDKVRKTLLKHITSWTRQKSAPREPI